MPQTNLPSHIAFASAISDEDHTPEALDEALNAVADQLGSTDIDLAITFATYHHTRSFSAIADEIERRLSPRASLAASTVGVIGSGYEIENKPGIAVIAARLGPNVWLQPLTDEDLRNTPNLPPPQQPKKDDSTPTPHPDTLHALFPNQTSPPAAIILFADPFSTPINNLLPPLNDALPGIPVIGGLASGANEPGENRLLLNNTIYTQGAVAVAIGGDIDVQCTVSQGCRPIGQPHLITQARHNIIQQLGRRPVLQVIQDTADNAEPEDRALLSEHGLLVGRVINEYKERFGRGDFLIRNIIGADNDHGYIAVNDLVKVGQTVQFHVRDRRTAEEDLRLLLQQQQINGPPAGSLIFSCNGRGRRLFNEPNAESNIIKNALGQNPIAGFFAAGELGPIGNQNFVHGFTASLAVFRPTNQPT